MVTIMRITLCGILPLFLAVSLGWTQEGASTDPWSTFRFLVGSWAGKERGSAGIGIGERSYQFILDNQYLHAKNTSTFEPQEKNPKGEVHKDWQFFSYDTVRNKIVLREFHTEGYVNQYTLEHHDAIRDAYVFISESLENAPNLRGRYTLIKKNDDAFEEIFELAFPGKDFGEILRNRWTRAK
jgi:hypothetical protein